MSSKSSSYSIYLRCILKRIIYHGLHGYGIMDFRLILCSQKKVGGMLVLHSCQVFEIIPEFLYRISFPICHIGNSNLCGIQRMQLFRKDHLSAIIHKKIKCISKDTGIIHVILSNRVFFT